MIKQNLDFAAVEKYRQAMERAGAQVEVKPMPVDVEEIELAPPPPATPVATPASTAPATARPGETPGALKVTPRDEYMAAFSDVEAPDFGIAPVGVDLQDARPEPEAPRVDLSQFSLAPVGSDMGEMPAPSTGPSRTYRTSSWRTDRSPPQETAARPFTATGRVGFGPPRADRANSQRCAMLQTYKPAKRLYSWILSLPAPKGCIARPVISISTPGGRSIAPS